jgi:23S rRNA (pseudouridine1915-N3)-methyltransferase
MPFPVLHIITVGQPRQEYARLGCAEYYKRLGRLARLRLSHVKDRGPEADGQALMAAAGRAHLIALDPRGQQYSTEGLSGHLAALAGRGVGEVALVVGGPDGLSEALRARAEQLWSLSQLTFPHDLAQLILAEALYRAASWERGEPYHRP